MDPWDNNNVVVSCFLAVICNTYVSLIKVYCKGKLATFVLIIEKDKPKFEKKRLF